MLLTGLLLYIFRDIVSRNVRFFLPVPPLGVAAYVFVFSMLAYYNGNLPGNFSDTLRELVTSAAISGVVFCAFIVANLALAYWLKQLF
jgi:hypothetical protein